MTIALATAAALPGLYADDRHLLRALRDHGLAAEPVVWEDERERWDRFGVCVIRSCWDYAFRRERFVGWARTTEAFTKLWNSAEAVAWNTHKGYLLALAQRGVPVVPTVLVARGAAPDLGALLADRGWTEVIVKPAVGASGRHTRRFSSTDLADAIRHLDHYAPHEDQLIQPFLPAVEHAGELSVIWVDGTVTHAVEKRAPPGDFRVHDDYGGTVTRVDPAPAALTVVDRAVEAMADLRPRYARIDLVQVAPDQWRVMELELVEPELFFAHAPHAVNRFVAMIAREAAA